MPPKSAIDILRDPETPAWIRDGFRRIVSENPSYAALLVALHDNRVGAQTPCGPIEKLIA